MYDGLCLDLAGTHPLFEDIPTFPYVGGAYDIQSGNSGNCGACWKLTNPENENFIYLTAINKADSGFDIGVKSLIKLFINETELAREIEIDAEKVASYLCGL